jgi:hypothetical protein
MKAIWKYQLIRDVNILELPPGARVLCVKEQREMICLWALIEVNPQAKPVKRTFRVYGTGGIPEDCGEYIGTVQSKGDLFVYHVFET